MGIKSPKLINGSSQISLKKQASPKYTRDDKNKTKQKQNESGGPLFAHISQLNQSE